MLFLLLMGICLSSCNKMEEPQVEKKGLYLQMRMPESIQVDTKADDAVLDNINIYNVWVLQFSEENNACLKGLYVPRQYLSKYGTSTREVTIDLSAGADGKVDDVDVQFSKVSSRFYVIANRGIGLLEENTGDGNALYALTDKELEKMTEEYLKTNLVVIGKDASSGNAANPLATSQPELLSAGPVAYAPADDGLVKVRIQMFRAFARINLTVKHTGNSDSFELTGSKIYNLPQHMALYKAGTATYPILNDIVEGPFELGIDKINTDTGATPTKIVYMAENMRGSGKSTTQQGKNMKDNGPGDGPDKLAGCTYIELEGTYKYNSSHTGGVGVKYTFYLGGNFTNDYNIIRDYSYDVTFNIAGPNSSDVRVKITNGNVAVFDDVVVIENIEVSI